MTKKRKSDNPVEAERREQKSRDAKKAKKQKEESHEKGMESKDPDYIRREIRRLEREGLENGKVSAMQKMKIERFQGMLEKATQRKKEQEEKRLQKHLKKLAKKGLKPEDSPYYHPVMNPHGMPPAENSLAPTAGAQTDSNTQRRRIPRPEGAPPPPRPFVPPPPRSAPPAGSELVPHPRPDLIEKTELEQHRKKVELAIRMEQRAVAQQIAAAAVGAVTGSVPTPASSANAVPTPAVLTGAASVSKSAPSSTAAAAAVTSDDMADDGKPSLMVDSAALKFVPTALRVKRAQQLAATTSTGASAGARSTPRAEGDGMAVDAAFAAFLQDMGDLGAI